MSILRNDLFGIPIVVVDGELNREHHEALFRTLDGIIGEGKLSIGLDLTGVSAVDSFGAELVRSVAEFLARHGGLLRILGTSATARCALGGDRYVAA